MIIMPKPRDGTALTELETRFCQEYLVDCNGTQAVIRSGYSVKGASVRAARLLGTVRISKIIENMRCNRVARTKVDADAIVLELASVGMVPREKCAEAGIGLNHKLKALELLMKHLGIADGSKEKEKPLTFRDMSSASDEELTRILNANGFGRAR